jgi:hypothetical protein
MNEFFDLEQWVGWFASLDRSFVFLLALPFVVAMIGLWSWWVEKEKVEGEADAPAAQPGPPPVGERRTRERRRRAAGSLPQHGFR